MANPFSNTSKKLPPGRLSGRNSPPKLQTYTPPLQTYKPPKVSIPAWTPPVYPGTRVAAPKSQKVYDAEDRNPVDWWRDPSIYDKTSRTSTASPATDGGGWGSDWGGGGGGGGEAVPISWSEFDAGVGNKPDWWKALKPSEVNEGTEFLASMNLLIPFLSPEDQRSVASTLYAQDAKNFGHLSPEKIGVDTPAISPDLQKYFTSSDRATKALAALEKLAGAVGKGEADMGKGYRYLRSILSAVKSYGAREGEQRMTKANMTSLYSSLDPLLNQGKSEEFGAYGPLATMLAKPFFTKGQLMPVGKTQDGRYIFGEANKGLL